MVGSDPSEDVCVYHESDDSFYIGIGRSRSERLLYIHAGAVQCSAVGLEFRWWWNAPAPFVVLVVCLPAMLPCKLSQISFLFPTCRLRGDQ